MITNRMNNTKMAPVLVKRFLGPQPTSAPTTPMSKSLLSYIVSLLYVGDGVVACIFAPQALPKSKNPSGSVDAGRCSSAWRGLVFLVEISGQDEIAGINVHGGTFI